MSRKLLQERQCTGVEEKTFFVLLPQIVGLVVEDKKYSRKIKWNKRFCKHSTQKEEHVDDCHYTNDKIAASLQPFNITTKLFVIINSIDSRNVEFCKNPR